MRYEQIVAEDRELVATETKIRLGVRGMLEQYAEIIGFLRVIPNPICPLPSIGLSTSPVGLTGVPHPVVAQDEAMAFPR